jgi:hypothetical protein
MVSRQAANAEVKICVACGREMTWRKAWARNWDQVRYCSDACRRRKITTIDEQLEAAIIQLLASRSPGSSICPSEAARLVAPDDEQQWRTLMEPARRAGRRLVAAGQVEFTQGGRVVDPSTAKGPIRIRRTAASGD